MYNFRMDELIPIVSMLAEMYTSKESSSITYDRARQLMGAVIYCINENSSFGNESEDSNSVNSMLVDLENNHTAIQAYNRGYELVLQKVIKSKLCYEAVIENYNGYRNQNYLDTVIKGMPQFFLYYDARFNPQDHILTLDYPTIKSIEGMRGVDAIYQYILYIQLEQEFLGALPEDYVTEILMNYHNDYEELIINICSIVLRNVLGNMIAGKNILSKSFKESDYNLIIQFVISSCTEEKVEEKLIALTRVLIKQLYQDKQSLFEYLKGDLSDFGFTLINAVKDNYLEVLFVT